MANWYLLRDGQTQGPYPEETIREWVRAGQIGPEERLNREGDPNWLSLDMIPEFAGPAPSPLPPTAPGATPFVAPTVAPGTPGASGSGIGAWLSDAWRLVTANLGTSIVVALAPFAVLVIVGVILALSGAPAMLSKSDNPLQALTSGGSMLLGGLISLVVAIVLGPALTLGATMCFWDMIRSGTLTTEKLLAGMPRFFSVIGWGVTFGVMGFVAGGIAGMIPVLGQLIAFLVSFPLMAWSSLALFDMAARDVGAIEGIGTGWNMFMRDPLSLSLLGLIAYIINLVGVALCCVGVLVAFPVIQTAWGLCYRDMSARS